MEGNPDLKRVDLNRFNSGRVLWTRTTCSDSKHLQDIHKHTERQRHEFTFQRLTVCGSVSQQHLQQVSQINSSAVIKPNQPALSSESVWNISGMFRSGFPGSSSRSLDWLLLIKTLSANRGRCFRRQGVCLKFKA